MINSDHGDYLLNIKFVTLSISKIQATIKQNNATQLTAYIYYIILVKRILQFLVSFNVIVHIISVYAKS